MIKRLLLSALSLWAMAPAIAQTWPEISPEMRPGTRWWWLGSAVDSVNLKRSIEEYAATGLGSLEITPIYGVKNNEHNEIGFLSPVWMAMLRTTEEIAGANGILVDMNQGTGWPFGGPEVSQDDAACKAIFLIDTVERGLTPVKTLPEKERRVAKLIAESRRPIDGGREEVVRAFQSRTFQTVKRAAPGGEGYVMDHFDRGAVARYLSKFDKAFKENGIPYPHNFFNDSYEVFGANWTPTLFDEFEKRRGYRLQDKLPELLGLIDDGNETLCDYRETLGELLLENFTQQWADWAHQRGTQVRNQAHGSPANLIDVYAAVDVPEIEGFGLSDFGIKGLRTDRGFTRKNDSDVSMLKYASSAAHITGKPLTSSETFTWLTEHFRTSLSQMKPDLDLMFTCGVNHVFFHGTTYSPFDDPLSLINN
ncbi:MAG: glycosyl hydrolase family 2, partial [Muribaculaceae bacterium]|nr:glycosyl hydrolase family 2 [Muribaculaceae bacterium]